jgi:hypothetical protein
MFRRHRREARGIQLIQPLCQFRQPLRRTCSACLVAHPFTPPIQSVPIEPDVSLTLYSNIVRTAPELYACASLCTGRAEPDRRPNNFTDAVAATIPTSAASPTTR